MKLLIIEDEAPAARRLRKILETRFENLGEWGKVPVDIEWAGDPSEVLGAAADKPDLIFLDLNLGGFDSLEWLRRSQLPADRIIIVSADTRYCDEAFALGVFAYVFKPIDESVLSGHIVRFMQSRDLIA